MPNYKILIGIFILLGTTTGLPALAAPDSVSIVGTVLSRCGTQYIYQTGTAIYANVSTGRFLEVFLDGVKVYQNTNRPTAWSTDLFTITEGDHTLRASIYRRTSDPVTQSLAATTTSQVTVQGCPSDDGGGGGGGGDEEEPVVTPPVKKQEKVRLAGSISNAAVPSVVEQQFLKVFGREPSKAESTYWKGRARSDKKTVRSLSGAMLFQKAKGQGSTDIATEQAFGIMGPDILKKNSPVAITWQLSAGNNLRYPAEKIEVCPKVNSFAGCVLLDPSTPNDGAARVSIPASFAYKIAYLRLTARDINGTLVPHLSTTRPVTVR